MAVNATILVDKATSDLLIGPDWAMNLEICDVINYDPGQARDVVKAVKKRLSNKSPKVQLLALTVLETVMKNCSEVVHQNVAEKEVLNEMVKIVKRKADMAVRDKILVLLDSWQEAFGGLSGKYPQYYIAYDDLRRSGVEFPERSADSAVPMFTPPPTHSPLSHQQSSYGSPPYAAAGPARLDAVMAATDSPLWGSKDMDAAQSGLEVLNEMLNAIDPRDKQAVRDDVIVQLVDQCRSYQKKILQLVNNISDESLLCQGLALNDDLQRALTKHDAIASGSPLPPDFKARSPKSFTAYDQEDEDAEDEFSQLAHRPSSRPGCASGTQPRVAAQFALPPPPQPIRKVNSRLDGQGRSLDLISGESFKDVSPTTPGSLTSPSNQQASSPFSEQQNVLNPFADSPSFVATPSPQGQQQMPFIPTSTSPHQQYQTPQSLQGPHQSSPGGYVVPWSSERSQVHGLQHQVSANHQQNIHNPYSPQPEGQHLQGAQTSSGWSSYGTNPVANLPPPPINYTERHRYFQDQTNQTNPQPPSVGTSLNNLEQQTMNLSLQDGNNRHVQNIPIGKLAQSSSFSANQMSPVTGVGSSEGASSGDRLFEDLVDLRSMSANFKKAGMSSSLTRPNTNKASGT